MRPETRFTRSGDVYLAYQEVGQGDRELLASFAGPTHLDGLWEIPELSGFFDQLAHVGRVVLFDKRGVGLSDRVSTPVPVETSAADMIQVMDAAGLERPVLFGALDGAAACFATAALYPDRVAAIVAVEPVPTFVPGGEPPWGFPEEMAQVLRDHAVPAWGQGVTVSFTAGLLGSDPRTVAAWQRYERMATTPATAAWWLENLLQLDVRPYLGAVHVPVLALHSQGHAWTRTDTVRWLVDQLPQGRLVVTDRDLFELFMAGGTVLDEIEELVAGTRTSSTAHRRLAVLLVTDLVGSTATMARLGEQGWRRLLEDHRRVVRAALRRYEGTEIDTAGDGFLASFRLPSQALRCAEDIRDASVRAGVGVRQGVHAGEVSVFETGVAGHAVHAAARVAAFGGAGDVVVTDTTLALVTGDHPPTEPFGTRALRGLPGRWRLHRLVPSAAVAVTAPLLPHDLRSTS